MMKVVSKKISFGLLLINCFLERPAEYEHKDDRLQFFKDEFTTNCSTDISGKMGDDLTKIARRIRVFSRLETSDT